MKTGLLICDFPAEPVLKQEGDYDKIFKETFKIPLVSFKVFKGELPAEKEWNQYDAFIITGSSASAYDDKDWIKSFIEFLRKLDSRTEIKVIGICFGFQILAQALGGQVVKNDKGWEVGPTCLDLNGLMIQSMHQDIVKELPKGWINLAGSVKCRNQFSIYKKRYFCLQGHPEYTKEIVTKITHFRKECWAREFYDQVLENLQTLQVDSKPWIKMILDFLHGDAVLEHLDNITILTI